MSLKVTFDKTVRIIQINGDNPLKKIIKQTLSAACAFVLAKLKFYIIFSMKQCKQAPLQWINHHFRKHFARVFCFKILLKLKVLIKNFLVDCSHTNGMWMKTLNHPLNDAFESLSLLNKTYGFLLRFDECQLQN